MGELTGASHCCLPPPWAELAGPVGAGAARERLRQSGSSGHSEMRLWGTASSTARVRLLPMPEIEEEQEIEEDSHVRDMRGG
jgi:hypothetical protein